MNMHTTIPGNRRGILAVGSSAYCEHVRAKAMGDVPRGLAGPIQANAGAPRGAVNAIADMEATLAEALQVITAHKGKTDAEMKAVQAAIDEMNAKMAAAQLGAGQVSTAVPDPAYTQAFLSFVRAGDNDAEARQAIHVANKTGRLAEINASMSVGSPADGGYLAPTEWDRKISAAQLPTSPMRRLANVVQTGVNAYSTLWNLRGLGSGWVGETAARTETTGLQLASITFGHGEIYAMPAVTQRLLDDAQIDMAAFLATEVGEEFGRQEAVTFIAGNGTNKPYGFLTYATGAANAGVHPGGAIQVTTAASATAIAADELIAVFYGLASPYRPGGTWLMNSTTALAIAKLKDGQGNYLWRDAFIADQPATLLGRPVELDENMPSIATGAIPVAFGDFKRGYVINDRTGVRILRDPFTAKPYVLFYSTKRVGGGVADPNAIRVLKMA